jgi:transcriptional regulator with XRE-family HTH domain
VAVVRPEAETFGRELRKVRLKRGLSQQALAERCGSNIPYISELERGLKAPTLTMILRLASALECKVRDLMRVFDTAPPDSFLHS